MITWNNLDKLTSYQELEKTESVDLAAVMAGENGAERVKNYSVPMAEGLTIQLCSKSKWMTTVLAALAKLAEEAQLAEKFEELYNGAVDQHRRETSCTSSSDTRTARQML